MSNIEGFFSTYCILVQSFSEWLDLVNGLTRVEPLLRWSSGGLIREYTPWPTYNMTWPNGASQIILGHESYSPGPTRQPPHLDYVIYCKSAVKGREGRLQLSGSSRIRMLCVQAALDRLDKI